MKAKRDLIQKWLDKADRDLLAAKHELTFEDAVVESVCFHCQQAVEKYIKAYLIYLDIKFPKSHDIGLLFGVGEVKDPNLSKLKEDADSLTDYAVEVRYPDSLFEPSGDDAAEAYEVAQNIRDYIKSNLLGGPEHDRGNNDNE